MYYLLLLFSFSFTILSLGQHISTRSTHFNLAERTGLLNSYSPPVHPSTLDMVFSDLVKSQLDPLLKTEYDSFIKEVEEYISDEISDTTGWLHNGFTTKPDIEKVTESVDEAKDYRVELEKKHIKALTIIRHIDKIFGKLL